MEANGLSKRFPGAVARGIYSITLEDIRYYFKPSATEENFIPTLNYDLADPQTVVPHAKLYGYDTSFFTPGMRQLDQVLRDMDKREWYLTNYNTLERVVHTLHMNEIWTKVKVHYDSISLQAIAKNEVCECVKATESNGILKMLHLMALKIRYPGLTSGKSTEHSNGMTSWDNTIYKYSFFNEWSSELKEIDFNEGVKKTREALAAAPNPTGCSTLVREQPGPSIKQQLVSSNPRPREECGRNLCPYKMSGEKCRERC